MASYHGDISLGDTIDIKFTTVSSGIPTQLAGSPVVSAYVDNGTTEITAGITLSVDFDSRTGLNNVRVVASSGNGFTSGSNVSLVITTGTVNGESVVGYEVGSFSIENRLADLYHADIQFTRDQGNTQDEWTVTWFKNGVRVTSGITSPTIQVVKRVDGTDLVSSVAMTQVGSTGSYKYDETTNRVTLGEAVLAIASATIDGSTRSFTRLIGRDSN